MTRPCGSCATSNKLDSSLGRGRWRWGHRAPVPPCLHVHQRPQGLQPQARGRRTRREARRPNLRPRGQGRGTVGLRLARVAPGDLVEWPDAPSELKARIVRLHRRIRQLSAWDLLGVGKDADAATVRRAFGAASKELHPDRYFGKNLGSFRAKLGAIFARLSEAMQEVEKARKSAK